MSPPASRVSNDVELERQFVSGLQVPNGVTNEFERADAAPFGTKGDGRLNAADLQQVMNYVAGLSAQQTAGGPDVPISGTAPLEEREVGADKSNGRAMRIINWSTGGSPVRDTPGRAVRGPVAIAIEIDSLGNETVALFTLNFDPSKLSNPVVTLADGMPEGTSLTANTRNAADGQVTVLLDSGTAFSASYGTRVVSITFDMAEGSSGETAITFDGSRSFSDAAARSLGAAYMDGSVTLKSRGLIASGEARGDLTGPLTFEAFIQ